jgi:Mg2+/Co2+ transporter CorB
MLRVNVLGRVILVTLSQNHEDQFSPDELERFVREQIESSKISQHCYLEKVIVLEDPSVRDSSLIRATST